MATERTITSPLSMKNMSAYFAEAGANLQNIDLTDCNLHCTCLSHVDLRDAKFKGSYLCSANLRHADLRGADLRAD